MLTLTRDDVQPSTYLGNGIAIPHGTPESRRHVRSTGVRVLQFPEGVQWHDGAQVNLLVTIAAQSDEHLDILRQLTHVLEQKGVAATLARATSADEVISTLAKEAHFFSIGTNDLTQYTLAIDRGHPQLSAQSDALHPAVLQMIRLTVEAAHAEGRWVGVCGELGSDPLAIPVLVGLGVDELSVSSRRVPLVKARIRELTLPRARELAALALSQATAAAVREALEAA